MIRVENIAYQMHIAAYGCERVENDIARMLLARRLVSVGAVVVAYWLFIAC